MEIKSRCVENNAIEKKSPKLQNISDFDKKYAFQN